MHMYKARLVAKILTRRMCQLAWNISSNCSFTFHQSVIFHGCSLARFSNASIFDKFKIVKLKPTLNKTLHLKTSKHQSTKYSKEQREGMLYSSTLWDLSYSSPWKSVLLFEIKKFELGMLCYCNLVNDLTLGNSSPISFSLPYKLKILYCRCTISRLELGGPKTEIAV